MRAVLDEEPLSCPSCGATVRLAADGPAAGFEWRYIPYDGPTPEMDIAWGSVEELHEHELWFRPAGQPDAAGVLWRRFVSTYTYVDQEGK